MNAWCSVSRLLPLSFIGAGNPLAADRLPLNFLALTSTGDAPTVDAIVPAASVPVALPRRRLPRALLG